MAGLYRYKTVAAQRGQRGKLIYNAFSSKPGQPPRKQTGRLQGSITYEIDPAKMTARVGTNLIYGKYLELGTRKMAKRPWLKRAIGEVRGDVLRILRTPMRLQNKKKT
jgi:HK97 gp10 family phage protein